MGTRIDIPQFDMYKQIVVAEKEGYIELNEDYLEVNQQYLYRRAEVDADEVIIKSRDFRVESAVYYRTKLRRSDISIVSLSYRDTDKGFEYWQMSIYILGGDDPVSFYFKKKSSAETAYATLSEWALPYNK